MYPGTTIEYVDESAVSSVAVSEVTNQPLLCCVFSSDKGTEEWKTYSDSTFFDMYGSISFAKHGQPLLQAAYAINNGAKILCKRVVAPNSTLANLLIVGTVTKVQKQAVNSSGHLLYLDAESHQTTEVTATPYKVDVAQVTYSSRTITNADSIADLKTAVAALTFSAGEYPLYLIADNGRGASSKTFKIQPNYSTGKKAGYAIYTFSVLESGSTTESISFLPLPELVNGQDGSMSLQSRIANNLIQVKCIEYEDSIRSFVSKISEYSTISTSDYSMQYVDFMFGEAYNGNTITYANKISFVSGTESTINPSYTYGLSLESGSNGYMGTGPFTSSCTDITQGYYTPMVEAFDGTYSSDIFDLNKYNIVAVIDAGYPAVVKSAITETVMFREDCIYLRDFMESYTTLDQMVTAADSGGAYERSKFCYNYPIYFDITDPYSKRQITVTIGYALTRLFVKIYNTGLNRPMAGILYGMIITEAIKGTVNIIPVTTPNVDQKETMETARLNYATYIGDDLVLETLYSSQADTTQFSYMNNILAIEEVIRAIRIKCPAIRYSFMDGTDLATYQASVQEVIDKYSSNFDSLTMVYTADDDYTLNKIFYATIKVQFKNFVQAEYFVITAINSSTTTSTT